ncbi:MAG: hypothetical protein EOO59_02785 [Hymenobacter sp.]|nr:MAG: hypothetical protein EOO59_02785 [Hymenobacter sp.]
MRILFGILFAGCGLLACKKEAAPTETTAVIGQAFDLAEQQTTTLPAGGSSPLRVTLTQVHESRCPTGVQCFLAGSVAVEVELVDATATPQLALIYRYDNVRPGYSRDSVSVVLNQQAYWLRLLDVTPYPSTTNGSQTKVATLRLRPY